MRRVARPQTLRDPLRPRRPRHISLVVLEVDVVAVVDGQTAEDALAAVLALHMRKMKPIGEEGKASSGDEKVALKSTSPS